MEDQREFRHRLWQLYKGFEVEVTALAVFGSYDIFPVRLVVTKEGCVLTDETLFADQIFLDVNRALDEAIRLAREKIDRDSI